MPWIITFVLAWVLFLLLIDKNNLRSMLGGFVASSMATLTDYGGDRIFDTYHFYDTVIPWGGCSFFYIFGVIFTMGTLFCQYYPKTLWLKLLHVLVLALLFLAAETLLIKVGAASYSHWNTSYSLLSNTAAFAILGWVAETFKLNIPELSLR